VIDQERLSSPQDAVEGLFALLSAPSGARSSGKAISTGLTGRVETLTDSKMMLLAAALSSKYSEALNQIWQRTDTDATKVSEEDWALANELAYQAIRAGLEGDEVARTVERVMRKGPYRSKWDEPRNGVTWLAQDVANALQTVKDRLKRYKEKFPDLPAGWVANGTVSSGDVGGDSRVNGAAPGKPVGSVLPWPEPARVLGLPAAPVLNRSLFPPEIANVALDAAERLQAPPDYLV